MAQASGTRVSVAYIRETTHGVTPATPQLSLLRTTSRNVNLDKNILESEEVRPDRMIADSRHGFNSVNGPLGFELSLAAFDDFIESALATRWATVTTLGPSTFDFDYDVGPPIVYKFVRSSGSFITDGLKKGMWIRASGYTDTKINGDWLIVSIVALEIVVAPSADKSLDPPTADEAGGGDESIAVPGKYCLIGTTLDTYTLERAFADIDLFQVFKGCAIQQMSLNIDPESMVNGEFTILGMSASPTATSTISQAAYTAAPTNPAMAAFDGGAWVDAQRNAVITALNVTINNNRALQAVVGSKFSPDVYEGRAIITGDLSFLLEDPSVAAAIDLYDKFVNETAMLLAVRMNQKGSTTDFLAVSFPNAQIQSAPIDPPAEGPVIASGTFQGLFDSGVGSSIMLQRSNA